MTEDKIPSYYEVVRLTHESEEATIAACVRYRRTPAPEMSLAWLRNSAYEVLSGQILLATLESAVEKKVPPNAWASVKLAVRHLLQFSVAQNWVGERLPNFNLEVGRGFAMQVRAAGRFHSDAGRWVVGLQPRLDGGPDLRWQMQTWLALLNEAYCTDPLAPAVPLVLDVSRDGETGKRGFHALDTELIGVVSRDELNARINLFLDCYKRAVELVPIRARRPRRPSAPEEHPRFPGT